MLNKQTIIELAVLLVMTHAYLWSPHPNLTILCMIYAGYWVACRFIEHGLKQRESFKEHHHKFKP